MQISGRFAVLILVQGGNLKQKSTEPTCCSCTLESRLPKLQ